MSREGGIFIVKIAGFTYRNAADRFEPGQPTTLEIEQRDNEASRLTLMVFDRVDPTSTPPYVEFNRFPNPRKVEDVLVQAWIGWADESLIKVFEGNLVIKSMDEEIPSCTKFVALDDTYKLRKRGKGLTLKNLSVRAMLKKKGAEHGVDVQFDPSVAGDPALNEPMAVFYQISETNWDLMNRYIRELGYITFNKERNILVVTRDKESADVFTVRYGDERIKRFSLREENKKDDRSPKRRGHHHEVTAGLQAHYPREVLVPNDSGKGTHWQEAALARDAKEHQHTLAKHAVTGKAKRREKEGDEATLEIRMEPHLINHVRIAVEGFGPDIDSIYESRMLRHSCGREWTTSIELWRP